MTKLFMMIGLPGCGKSTEAKKIAEHENAVIFSSDALRQELYGDENIQGDNNVIFNELHKRIINCLKSGTSAVYDATNINMKKRVAFLSTIKHLNCEKIAVFMATPYTLCIVRNNSRERHVPEEVVKRMYKNFNVPCYQEGFTEIKIVYPEDTIFTDTYSLLNEMVCIPHDNHNHSATIGTHMSLAYFYLLDTYKDSDGALALATLLHDIGKPFTKEFKNGKGEQTEEAHYFGHMNVGAYNTFLLNIPEELKLEVALLTQYHMEPYLSWKQSEKAKERDLKFFGEDFVKKIEILHECDENAH